ncbi:MAG: class I SAM-dependent RNA methyltransferase [Myxococcota bacterium]
MAPSDEIDEKKSDGAELLEPAAHLGDSEPVRITGWASGGEGVGRLSDGRVIFIEGAVPGDLVAPSEIAIRKKMAWGKVGRLVEASADRVDPSCAHFETCGGCTWQHVRYPAQLEAKRENVRNALSRIGGIDFDAEIEIIGSPNPYGYRARARLAEAEGGVGYRMRGSRRTLAIEECPILVPTLQEGLSTLAKQVASEESPASVPAPEATAKRRPRTKEWVLTAGSSGAALVQSVKPGRNKTGGRRGRRPRPNHGDTVEHVLLEVLGEKLRASGTSFIQGNALLWDDFAKVVTRAVLSDSSPERFVELYAGIGFFTLPLVRAGLSGVVIESDASATADLAWNLEEAKLQDRVQVVTARVEKRGDLAQQFSRGDVLLVDPPRTGLDRAVCDAIVESGPARLVYVSCDSGTWARDLGRLAKSAYRLAGVEAFDLFPQTPHVEIVSRLERIAPNK